MALSSALFSGVAGLQVHQSLLDVVGNNLANSNTAGYKGQAVQFQDLVYQTLRSGAAAGGKGGGTNPQQIGYGSVLGSISTNFQQGALQTTGRNLDLAIQGNGFFVVNDGTQDLYTRAGAFQLDADNFVVDSATGFRVQRTGSVGEGSATSPAFQTVGDKAIQVPLGFGIAGQPTTTVSLRGNLSASTTVGGTYTSAIQVFDTQGGEHILTMLFTKTGDNTYSATASVSGGTVTGSPITGITFSATGTLLTPATANLSLAFPTALPAAQPLTIRLGTIGQGDGLTQFGGDNTAEAIRQDGYSAGSLTSFTVDKSGILQGVFSNGVQLPLAQLGLAYFANQGGLSREGQNLFAQTGSSGPPLIDVAGTPSLGSIQAGALEASNVDVSSEFTRLIIAQRGFQINARTVTASSDLLQELANLVR